MQHVANHEQRSDVPEPVAPVAGGLQADAPQPAPLELLVQGEVGGADGHIEDDNQAEAGEAQPGHEHPGREQLAALDQAVQDAWRDAWAMLQEVDLDIGANPPAEHPHAQQRILFRGASVFDGNVQICGKLECEPLDRRLYELGQQLEQTLQRVAEVQTDIQALAARIDECYYAPGMPGSVAAADHFDSRKRLRPCE